LKLHHELNAKLQAMEQEFESSALNFVIVSKAQQSHSSDEEIAASHGEAPHSHPSTAQQEDAAPLGTLTRPALLGGVAMTHSKLGIIASGVAYQVTLEALAELGAVVPVLKIGTPYPLPRRLVKDFVAQCERVLVIEEPDACIELQIDDRSRVSGRLNQVVPNAGELSPEVITSIVASALQQAGCRSIHRPMTQRSTRSSNP
jgi:TPP-dependent indolepyruvate ferredoxin oxidoreductase alpha subunit